VARRLGDVELVTVDSMQVYRGMDIGTAKPSAAERSEVPHHLLDLADPSESWSLTRWTAAARAAITGIESRAHRALLVGGTGLYFQSLVDGLRPPGRYPVVKAGLDAEPDTAGLYRRLTALDPLAATKIQPSNRRRVIRALEVTIGGGRPFSTYGPGLASYPATPWQIAGVWLPRPVIAARITKRLDAMVAAGLVDEVARMASRPGGLSRTARQALGYREILGHLEGGVPLSASLAEADRRTRAFARRQRVWWRRDPRVRWYGSFDNPLAVIPQLLGDWRLS
jgi:tRNA dimethylallyltransferase